MILNSKDIKEKYATIVDKYFRFNFPHYTASRLTENYFDLYVKNKNSFLTKKIFKDKMTYSKRISIKVDPNEYLRLSTPSIFHFKSKIIEAKSFIIGLKPKEVMPYNFSYFAASYFTSWYFGELNEKEFRESFRINNKKYTFSSDQKPTKIFTKFYNILKDCGATTKETDKEFKKLLDELSDYYSRIILECSIEGELEISIDPMEMLTASMNNCGWTSCYSVSGCNSGAPAALMNSDTTFIAYVKTKNPYHFYPDELKDTDNEKNYCANKKIRVWVYADKDNLIIGKNYPYSNDSFKKAIVDFVNEITNNYYEDSSCLKDDYTVKVNSVYDDGTMKGVHRRNSDVDNISNTIYANDVAICPICGKEYTSESVEDYDLPLICQDCLGYKRCACCGGLYRKDEGTEIDGIFYCDDCLEDFGYNTLYDAYVFADDNYTTTTEHPDCQHLQNEILRIHCR